MSKFKVGDRVEVTKAAWVDIPRGTRGHVVRERTGHLLRVAFKSGTARWFFPHELKPLRDQTFRLERGDRIINNRTGRKGVVVEGQDGHLWVVDHTYSEDTGAPASALEEHEEHYPGTYEIITETAPW